MLGIDIYFYWIWYVYQMNIYEYLHRLDIYIPATVDTDTDRYG